MTNQFRGHRVPSVQTIGRRIVAWFTVRNILSWVFGIACLWAAIVVLNWLPADAPLYVVVPAAIFMVVGVNSVSKFFDDLIRKE